MSVFVVPFNQCSVQMTSQVSSCVTLTNKPISSWRQKRRVTRSYYKREAEGASINKNYYELLGVSVDSNAQEIREAYRKLQKKYHPDIAGQGGHEHTLKLNEAYKVLMREDFRRNYDTSIGQMRIRSAASGCSSWRGPLRPKALFVDENACIGCRECVHHAGNTFIIDEAVGSARVKLQFGDDDQKIEVSIDSCPVNCIHWVDSEELPVLEFLMQPHQKKGYGVFGNGWERPKNVFAAAKSFNKELKQQAAAGSHRGNAQTTVEEETPAQAAARENASMKIKMERFSTMWNSLKEFFGSTISTTK